jgi:hypothetical protein
VIRVAETDSAVAGAPPTVTPVAPRRFVPLIVRDVFPAAGPLEGVTLEIEGVA